MIKPYCGHAQWDAEAQVWFASSDEVPGLATEADTIECLIHKLKTLIPELLELNSLLDGTPITFKLLTRRFEHAA